LVLEEMVAQVVQIVLLEFKDQTQYFQQLQALVEVEHLEEMVAQVAVEITQLVVV
jgi:hypothetical protein